MEKIWVEFHHSYASAEVCDIWKGTEEQMLNHIKENWDGYDDLTYEELMDCDFQNENDFTLTELPLDIIKDLK